MIAYQSLPRKWLGALALLCLLPLAPANAGWEMTFNDEFDAPALDQAKWKPSDLWGNQTLGGNSERQCYLPSAVSQADGTLRLTASPQATARQDCHGANSDLLYSSGEVTTAGCNQWERKPYCATLKRFAQAYGYFEMRAKFPRGKGFWPAFWLIPIDGKWPPEIDIVEALGHEPAKAYATYHYNDAAGAHKTASTAFNGPNFTDSFNTFGLDWQPGLLIWYLNGREVFRYASETVSDKPMYLLLNLAVGGDWPGPPDASTVFPSKMEIDYVRVYRRTNDGTPNDLPPSGKPN
jgi:beta-glucanase (GH16 family)